MEIIPAIDVIDGQCVRLSQGRYQDKTVYHKDPLEVAKSFAGAGLTRLHLVDLDGAKAKHVVNWRILERIAHQTDLSIDFGGGVKSDDDLRIVFESGADQATAGSIAATDPALFHRWLDHYGPSKLILGADLKEGKIATHGWQQSTEHGWEAFLTMHTDAGAETVICTDVAQDGMLQGPSSELYRNILETFPSVKLIASGGVSSLSDLQTLRELGCHGAIIGKAIYEGYISLIELERFQYAG
ncbi:MAG: 1-(5-phosphoribosyl)-5-[(5-phosphoribosylamino)methylideneamino]imidazole-4-carboxamide isomerase [Saprospiraceae bacterium]|nr:1-(5-phosphoribosyl)-5-[(5-phosphoribosylamino)methylideneamino]imidazole-4-carboxamide isomerase [Saprospiraceae bacterium]